MPVKQATAQLRQRLDIKGTVQGVGFRPFVQRLAVEVGVSGWVANSSGGAVIEVQGGEALLKRFHQGLRALPLANARIETIETQALSVVADIEGDAGHFVIMPTTIDPDRASAIAIPHDLAPCDECLREFHDPHNRRYQYPFISCTACGPRWSVLRSLPYDRGHTSFSEFSLCEHCRAEYQSPHDRRCHYQAISCPQCGPGLSLLDHAGVTRAQGDGVLALVTEQLRQGNIVALKSVGGFQLLVDALNPEAVQRLRQRKHRPAKPLAVMFASLQQLHDYGDVEGDAYQPERQALSSAVRPIVLVNSKARLPDEIAGAAGNIGAMLPPSPLHELLFTVWSTPLVATSGNRSGERLCIDNREAQEKLGGIADCFVLHDLIITQPLDDSVVRVINGKPVTIRAGRGLAPYVLPVNVGSVKQKPRADKALLAVGGHQKNSLALSLPDSLLASAHIGDLDALSSLQRFERIAARGKVFCGSDYSAVITDLHPDYGSSQWAAEAGYRIQRVQHHVAHFFSVMAEHNHRGPALGICWDGSGLGDDGNLWGGECFLWDGQRKVQRVAHLHPFPLPGGESAIREPRRQALGLLTEAGMDCPAHLRAAFSDSELRNLHILLKNRVNSPLCSSAGRLIDAVAALLQVAMFNRFEADAAMQLEALAWRADDTSGCLPFALKHSDRGLVIDWRPMVKALLERVAGGNECRNSTLNSCTEQMTETLAATVHNTLAAMITATVHEFPALPVFLSGGVFQNRYLTETAIQSLEKSGREVFTHAQVPPNDGGLAVGQLYSALQSVDLHYS
ncbi:carbamoyltransferase HypF [Pseudomaricurvus hydrocarbonicus]|nr:carbamoyltransferase HypF [Aestuariicella hydrocarbonica]